MRHCSRRVSRQHQCQTGLTVTRFDYRIRRKECTSGRWLVSRPAKKKKKRLNTTTVPKVTYERSNGQTNKIYSSVVVMGITTEQHELCYILFVTSCAVLSSMSNDVHSFLHFFSATSSPIATEIIKHKRFSFALTPRLR